MTRYTLGGTARILAVAIVALFAVQARAQQPTNAIDPDFITLGYVQSATPAWGYQYHSMTHLAMLFTDFDADGNLVNPSSWTNRSSLFQPGGKAARNGTKLLLTLRNAGFSSATLNSVMLDPARRATLVNSLVALVGNDPNCHGINMDFEPVPYGAGVGAAIVDFCVELRAALPNKELSKYVGPTYYASSYPDLPRMMTALDYVNISCYPYSGSFSNTSAAIAPLTRDGASVGFRDNTDRFMENGVPPDKMVLTLASYGYGMLTNSPEYGVAKVSNLGSIGFTQGRFATGLANPLQTRRFKSEQESVWYAVANGGGTYNSYQYDDELTIALKARGARNWYGSQHTGKRLRGVGFWSLAWMGPNFLGGYSSTDLETGATGVSKTRTYPMIYQDLQEIFAPPGTREFILEKWEYDSASISTDNRNRWDRWRNPTDSLDNVGVQASLTVRSIEPVPFVGDFPKQSNYSLRLGFNFTSAANSRLFHRWEILGDHVYTNVADLFATVGSFPANSIVRVDMKPTATYANRTIRFVAMDSNGELELSPAFPLSGTDWQTLEWDLSSTAPGNVTAYNTNHQQYRDGNGVLNSALIADIDGNPATTLDIVQARDVAIVGFLVEGNGTAGSGSILLDELRYSPGPREGKQYLINEFRYHDTTRQFVEVYGPAGPIPNGLELRIVTGSTGALTSTVLLNGSIADSGNGYGYHLIGTSLIPFRATTVANGFLNVATPAGMQLLDTQTGYIHDAVTYRAFSGTARLDGQRQPLVTVMGFPWLGEANTGTTGVVGEQQSFARHPDGDNTWINGDDFALMVPTPGNPNGPSISEASLPVEFDLETVPPGAIQTYQSFRLFDPVAAGLPASPGGGLAHRAVDTSGGGVISFIGDRDLGGSGNGYRVKGDIFIPASSNVTPIQSIAVGFCGSQGTTFFTNTPSSSGFEDGYWLIYQNRPGAALNNGRAEHPAAFEFVHATNNGIAPQPVVFLGSATRPSTGAAAEAWTSFELLVDPNGLPGEQLVAKVNDSVIFSGDIPAGGPIRGAVQIGFRENHDGGPAASEGTWVDNLSIEPAILPPDPDTFDIFSVF